jgi:SAM-dependent methyltransferase
MTRIDFSKEQHERDELLRAVADEVNGLLPGNGSVHILEAGCGSASHVAFARPVVAVGIDVSRAQLDKNSVISEKILGDLQTYPLPAGAYDAVVCWDVLEHLSDPLRAMRNMFQSLKPGGLAIFAFPNVLSLKGLVTKATPYSFHKFMYRRLKYTKLPFHTYLRLSMRPNNVKRVARSSGLSVEFTHLFEAFQEKRFRAQYPAADVLFRLVGLVVGALTFGTVNPSHSQCILILKR